MIPFWWALVAFVAGGCAGLLIALMRTAADLDDSSLEPVDANDRPFSVRNG